MLHTMLTSRVVIHLRAAAIKSPSISINLPISTRGDVGIDSEVGGINRVVQQSEDLQNAALSPRVVMVDVESQCWRDSPDCIHARSAQANTEEDFGIEMHRLERR